MGTFARIMGHGCLLFLHGAASLFSCWLYAQVSGREYVTQDFLGLSITYLVMAFATLVVTVLAWAITNDASPSPGGEQNGGQ